MRLYLVQVEVDQICVDESGNDVTQTFCVRKFAGSMSEVSAIKNEFVAEYQVKRKDCESEEVEVPTQKAGLIAYLNELIGG